MTWSTLWRSLLGVLLIAPLATWGMTPTWAAGPSIQLVNPRAADGDRVTLNGAGFHPNVSAVISVTFDAGSGRYPQQTAARTAGNGTLSAQIAVPANANPGAYTITVRDFQGLSASTVLRVLPVLHMQPGAPAQTVTVTAGHGLFVSGSGFAAGERVQVSGSFSLYSGATSPIAATITTATNGTFSHLLVNAPTNARQGRLEVTAHGQTSGKSAIGAADVVYHPTLSGGVSARPGATVTVTGSGFVAGAHVTITASVSRYSAPAVTLSAVALANAYGQIAADFHIPNGAQSGTYRIVATDSASGLQTEQKLVVRSNPAVIAAPTTVRPGDAVKVRGSGFAPNVNITITTSIPLYAGGSRGVSFVVRTDAGGAFTTFIAVPSNAAAGGLTVVAQAPHARVLTHFSIAKIASVLTVSPVDIRPGQTVTVRGSSYLAGDRVNIAVTVTLTNGTSRKIGGTATVAANGTFSTQIQVPLQARGGTYQLSAVSANSGRTRTAVLRVAHFAPAVSVAPISVIPGARATVHGSGYLPNTNVQVTVAVILLTGARQDLSTMATTDAQGNFLATVSLPGGVRAGTYTLSARNVSTGRVVTSLLHVVKLAPSVVISPAATAPGAQIAVNGFGFAFGQPITVFLNGQKVGTATTNTNGQFGVKITIPASAATGSQTVSAVSSSGRKATASLSIQRQIQTHAYFASIYTGQGYQERLAFLNPSPTTSRVTILYEPTIGGPRTKVISVAPHSRFTENVNADLGVHVSAGAAVSADTSLVVSRVVYHGGDGSVVSGATAPATSWYFANGNTSHRYREYLAIDNPNRTSVQVVVHLLPTHHAAFNVVRTVGPTARTTVKVNSYVRDAVGALVTASMPVVANRTTFVLRGMDSKIGASAPQRTWIFAGGPRGSQAHNWIGVINPSGAQTYVTLRAYGPAGAVLGTVHQWMRPQGRAGFLINRIARQPDAAVVVTSSRPTVAEQTTYGGRNHMASTDIYGVPAAATGWGFAAADTTNGGTDSLVLFNPGMAPAPIVVQFMTSTGAITQRTYVVAPHAHTRIDVGSVEPNAQVGITASSSLPFVALNRMSFNGGQGATTSTGTRI